MKKGSPLHILFIKLVKKFCGVFVGLSNLSLWAQKDLGGAPVAVFSAKPFLQKIRLAALAISFFAFVAGVKIDRPHSFAGVLAAEDVALGATIDAGLERIFFQKLLDEAGPFARGEIIKYNSSLFHFMWLPFSPDPGPEIRFYSPPFPFIKIKNMKKGSPLHISVY